MLIMYRNFKGLTPITMIDTPPPLYLWLYSHEVYCGTEQLGDELHGTYSTG